MAYRYGDRGSQELFPRSIEEYISEEDPVRVYDAFVEGIDLEMMGIVRCEERVGNSEYEPRSMVKLCVYGVSYGERGSRKLERACHHNVSFIWLMGGLKPDHNTISRFMKRNCKALGEIMKQGVRLCMKLGLVKGNTLFLDSSKLKANASRGKMVKKWELEEYLKEIDKHIEETLKECERIDKEERERGVVSEGG